MIEKMNYKKNKLQNKINFLEVQKEFYIEEKKIYSGIQNNWIMTKKN